MTQWMRALLVPSAAALFAVAGCADAIDGPDIVSVTVTPDSITPSGAQMTDRDFVVVITTDGFEEPITDASVAIMQNDRRAAPRDTQIEAATGTATLTILQTWFAGLGPGTYEISATVSSASETVTEAGVATVTVEAPAS